MSIEKCCEGKMFENAHERLKKSREAAGFKTATAFCEKFNIPISTFNMHETGRRKLKLDIAEKYANLLGVNAVWLLTGETSPYGKEESNHTDIAHKFNSKTLADIRILENVNSLLFSKIVICVHNACSELDIELPLLQLASEVVNIYEDILSCSNSEKDQLMMVDFATTIFKKSFSPALKGNQN